MVVFLLFQVLRSCECLRKSHVIECARETLRMSRRNEKEIKAQHVRPPIRHRVCQLIFLSRLKLRKKFNEVAETMNVKSPISRHFQFRFSYKNKLFLNLFYAARGKKQEKSFNLQLHNIRDLFCALRQKSEQFDSRDKVISSHSHSERDFFASSFSINASEVSLARNIPSLN